MIELLEEHRLILMEAAIVERLRRTDGVQLHETLLNAPLIYDELGSTALGTIYQEYIDIASQAELPLLLCTPTWRASRSRVHESDRAHFINIDAARYMRVLCEPYIERGARIHIGGMIGCRNDCYKPEEALTSTEARAFHSWQIDQLVQGGVDFLIAETLPSTDEALGIAMAMEQSQLPYIISFVIARDGKVLDGTTLETAIDTIDAGTVRKPLGYMVNCAHPSFLNPDKQPQRLFSRLIGFQANASALDHCDLDESCELHADDLSEWGELMLELNRSYGVNILGGCCGTGADHLHYLVDHFQTHG